MRRRVGAAAWRRRRHLVRDRTPWKLRISPMKSSLLLFVLLPAVAVADPGPQDRAVPSDWVDPATGHRVIRLSGDEGGSSLYFHQNTYTPKGDRFIFNTGAGIVAVDLTKLGKGPVTPEVVVPGARAIATAWRTPDVYYHKAGVL